MLGRRLTLEKVTGTGEKNRILNHRFVLPLTSQLNCRLEYLQSLVHYSLHFLAPGMISWLFFRDQWKKAWLIMLTTMLVDLDHIFACSDLFPIEGGIVFDQIPHLLSCKEIFVPTRCSIGFHPLHTYYAVTVYILLLIPRRTRIAALGLVLHMATDYQDCLWMTMN